MPDAPKAPQTAEEARALADKLDADAAVQEETAAKTRRSAAAWRAYARALEDPELNSSLSSDTHSGITNSMNSTQIDSAAKKRRTGPPLKSKGPAAKVARILGVSLAELADKAKVNVHSLRTWDQRESLPAEVQGVLADLVRAHEKQAKRAR